MEKSKEYYRQRLPHIQPLGAAFFITFRLFEAVPKSDIINLKEKYLDKLQKLKTIKDPKIKNQRIYQLRRDHFIAQEKLLEDIQLGPQYLKNPDVAKIIMEEIKRFDNESYHLICFSIMSNHVHLVIDTAIQLDDEIDTSRIFEAYKPLDVIMKRIKGPTAVRANRIINRSGQFWERESFDSYIRDEKMFHNVVSYTLNNPVKAGLVKNWQEWPYTYLSPSIPFK